MTLTPTPWVRPVCALLIFCSSNETAVLVALSTYTSAKSAPRDIAAARIFSSLSGVSRGGEGREGVGRGFEVVRRGLRDWVFIASPSENAQKVRLTAPIEVSNPSAGLPLHARLDVAPLTANGRAGSRGRPQ